MGGKVNLERLLVQTSFGEAVFSKVVGAAPKRTSASPARLLAELESDLPELLFICQRRSRREFTLNSCTPISATKETFEVLAQDTTQGGPLNRSVHWRVDRRFGEPIICSTFVASRQELQSPDLQLPKFLLPETSKAKVTIENYTSNKWKRIRRL